MSFSKPFHRNYRAIVQGPNAGYSEWGYIIDHDYAESPEHYVRAFLLIQKDLQTLFEYVDPSDQNLNSYSFRMHELFMRSCIETEANFKAILKENIFNPTDKTGKLIPENRWNIHFYKKINKTHHLSGYKVHVPIWDGSHSVFEPFKEWETQTELTWYQAYNRSKHDRQTQFKEANLENLLNAILGLLALLTSQFRDQDFSPGPTLISASGYDFYPAEEAIGNFFRIEYPDDWDESEKYDFDWSTLKDQADRFEKIDYDHI
jgi:hypothetical protein